jgi:broad-specificity NMP kinase
MPNRSYRIIELVGPAGAGKTSLARVLSEYSEITLVKETPYYRRFRDIPFFIKNTLLILPTLIELQHLNNSRWPTLEPIIWMITLKGWHKVLAKKLSKCKPIIILDEGPIFYLTFLFVYGPEILKSPKARKWWESMYQQWADTLDMVIWLDTYNKTLVNRIRSRKVWHGVKVKSDMESFKYLDDLRAAYLYILPSIAGKARSFKVLHFDTGQESIDQICDRVKVELDL